MVDAWVVAEARERRRDRVVGLVLDHRPHGDAERPQRTLRILELREQLVRDAGTRLVAGEEIVAPRLDDMVGRRADVGHVRLAQQAEHAVDQAAHRVDRAPVRPLLGRPREMGAEELERGVDEVELHARPMVPGTARCARAPAR